MHLFYLRRHRQEMLYSATCGLCCCGVLHDTCALARYVREANGEVPDPLVAHGSKPPFGVARVVASTLVGMMAFSAHFAALGTETVTAVWDLVVPTLLVALCAFLVFDEGQQATRAEATALGASAGAALCLYLQEAQAFFPAVGATVGALLFRRWAPERPTVRTRREEREAEAAAAAEGDSGVPVEECFAPERPLPPPPPEHPSPRPWWLAGSPSHWFVGEPASRPEACRRFATLWAVRVGLWALVVVQAAVSVEIELPAGAIPGVHGMPVEDSWPPLERFSLADALPYLAQQLRRPEVWERVTETWEEKMGMGDHSREAHLRVLGLPSDATWAEVRSAYRAAAKHTHPDKRGEGADGDEFLRIQRAYESLRRTMDPKVAHRARVDL